MKKHFILSALTIFLSSISLGLTSCNFSTAKKLKTIQVNNSSQYGTIELEKYEGLVNEEINGSISAKSGYKVEYVLFNNEFIEINEDNTFKIKIEDKENILSCNFIKVISSSFGQITFLNKDNNDELSPIDDIKKYSLVENLELIDLSSENTFFTSNERNIIVGSNNESSFIKVSFSSPKYIKSISLLAKSYSSSSIIPTVNINYGNLVDEIAITTNYVKAFTLNNAHTIECNEFSISLDKNEFIELNKLSFEFGEKETIDANIVSKYNDKVYVLVNESVDILNYINFEPYNLKDKRIILECDDKSLNINGTVISSEIEKEYSLKVSLATDKNISLLLNVKFTANLMNPGTIKLNKHNNSLNVTDIKNNLGLYTLPTIGELNLVAVPIEFSDLNSKWDDTKLNKLDDVLNSDNLSYFESLSSYYNKSSYGNLSLHIDIADVLIPSFSSSVYLSKADDYAGETFYLIKEIYTSITINGTKLSSLISNYDYDKDNKIDGIYFIINEFDMSKVNVSRFWAYTYWYIDTNCGYFAPNIPLATFCSLAGAFNYRDSYDGNDAHTLIHETGHMLGAEDYYSYDGESRGYSGGLDMMDLNIGDHSAFTKYLFSWVKPYLLDLSSSLNKFEITLNTFESSGDCLIIPSSSFNNSPFGEYLIIEYLTNDYLNNFDSSTCYYEGIYFYSTRGIRVFHVNSRLIKYAGTKNVFMNNNEYKLDEEANYATYAYSNTPSLSYEKNVPLYQLVSKKNEKLYGKRLASNNDLFMENDIINSSTISASLKNNKFYDGSDFNYSITIDSLTFDQATLTVNII